MIDRTAFCSRQLSRIFSISFGPMPLTCDRNVGDWSITSRVLLAEHVDDPLGVAAGRCP